MNQVRCFGHVLQEQFGVAEKGWTDKCIYVYMDGWMNHDETLKLALRENKDTVIRVKHESVYIPELNEIKKKCI